MSKELKMQLLWALFVGVLSGIVIAVYAALNVAGIVEAPVYWACFIILPTVMMFGGQWRDIPFHWINVLCGLFLGWVCFQIFGATAGSMGVPLALGVATCLVTVVLQALTGGFLANNIGRCPMAFVGLITCFACGGENLIVAAVSLVVGIVTATVMAQSGNWAAKIVGLEQGEQK